VAKLETAQIRLQRLKDLTVDIRDAKTEESAGTGVLISAAGFAVTCAHVVAACRVEPRKVDGGELLVRLPKTSLHDELNRRAKVFWFPPSYEDDLVILQLEGGSVPPERVGVCGPAGEDVQGRPFSSWGFRQRGDYRRGLGASGTIVDHVASEKNYLLEPLQLASDGLDRGMSGAAVLDTVRNLVVGFVFQVWSPTGSLKDRDLAFAVDAGLLSESPLGDMLVTESLAPQAVAQPVLHSEVVASLRSEEVDRGEGKSDESQPLPGHLGLFIGRAEALAEADQIWIDGHTKILGVTGLPGIGKTSLVIEWVRQSRALHGEEEVRTPFWWSFDPAKSEEDAFFTSLISFLSSGAVDGQNFASAGAKANLAAALLPGAGRSVIILDDLSSQQASEGDTYGTLTDGAMKDFLTYAAAAEHNSLIILTSEFPFSDFHELTGFSELHLGRLSIDAGKSLLAENGISGDPTTLESIVSDWDGHPQALAAVAIYLKTMYNGVARSPLDLSDLTTARTFETRLQAIGEAIQQRRTPAERAALAVLALARAPVSEEFLNEALESLSAVGLGPSPPPTLDGLYNSEAIRRSAAGILPHPVLRNLYRVALERDQSDTVRSTHRLLANHYYSRAARHGATFR